MIPAIFAYGQFAGAGPTAPERKPSHGTGAVDGWLSTLAVPEGVAYPDKSVASRGKGESVLSGGPP